MFHSRNFIIMLCLLIASLSGVILYFASISPVGMAYANSDPRADAPEYLISTKNLQPEIGPIVGPDPVQTDGLPSSHFSIPWSIADLDAASSLNGSRWQATITLLVVDTVGNPVVNGQVFGSWSYNQMVSCVTDAAGRCSLTSKEVELNQVSRLTFTVDNIIHLESPLYIYHATRNTDPDGDSDGTTIVIHQP